MNVGTAALAASLNLKTADLLRVLSANAAAAAAASMNNENGAGLLCEANKQLNETFQQQNPLNKQSRKRCRDEQTSSSSNGDEEDLDEDEGMDCGEDLSDLTVEIPTALHKHANNNNIEEWCQNNGMTGKGHKNGFRGELKRPDLKGSFRCTICQKVFCHSSSLSRHRMQAHFKSYTCTLCSKEITSNETLRAHMLKQHQISRMFMCRCCNWAFPDKTSLHMHMQLQGKNSSSSSSSSLEKDSKVIGKSNVSPCQSTLTANSTIPPKNSNDQNFGSTNSLFGSQTLQMNVPKFPQQFFGASTPNMFNGNGMHAAFLAAAAANANGSNQGQGLFPANLQTEALLNLQQHFQQHQPMDQKTPTNTGLFPQLSMMRNDNVDLLSKLRQRLFLSNMWAAANQQKIQGFQPEQKLPMNFAQQQQPQENENEKLLAQFLENNNQLNGARKGSERDGREVVETSNSPTSSTSNSTSPTHQQQSKNLAQLMQMLHKNALQQSSTTSSLNENNNDETKQNLMLNEEENEADSNNNNNNNNNSLKKDEEENDEEENDDEENGESEMGRLNFLESPLNNNNNNNQMSKNQSTSSSVHHQEEEDEDEDAQSNQSQNVQEQNANLTQKLLEFRQRLSNFVQQEPQLDAAHASFLQNLLKLTY